MDEGFELRYYVVAFLDVLGQRDRLRELRGIPRTTVEERATLEVLSQTAGFVLDLRRSFNRHFETVSKPTGLLDDLPDDQRMWAEACRRGLATHRGISDSMIITVPLTNENDYCNSLGSIYSTLVGTAALLTTSLAQRHAVRGGIDVGVAIELSPDEVYGAALERAYALEAKAAEWPRVLIGNELWKFLSLVDQLPDGPTGRLAKSLAAECKKLVVVAADDRRMLDFLGEGVRDIAGGLPLDVVEAAYEFVVSEERRLRVADDRKLAPRYQALRGYLESRIGSFGLEKRSD